MLRPPKPRRARSNASAARRPTVVVTLRLADGHCEAVPAIDARVGKYRCRRPADSLCEPRALAPCGLQAMPSNRSGSVPIRSMTGSLWARHTLNGTRRWNHLVGITPRRCRARRSNASPSCHGSRRARGPLRRSGAPDEPRDLRRRQRDPEEGPLSSRWPRRLGLLPVWRCVVRGPGPHRRRQRAARGRVRLPAMRLG